MLGGAGYLLLACYFTVLARYVHIHKQHALPLEDDFYPARPRASLLPLCIKDCEGVTVL